MRRREGAVGEEQRRNATQGVRERERREQETNLMGSQRRSLGSTDPLRTVSPGRSALGGT